MLPQGVLDHFLVARLENVKGEERVRKKKRARKRHHGNSLGQIDRLIHGHWAAGSS